MQKKNINRIFKQIKWFERNSDSKYIKQEPANTKIVCRQVLKVRQTILSKTTENRHLFLVKADHIGLYLHFSWIESSCCFKCLIAYSQH